MDGSLRGDSGGIQGLHGLICQYREAIRYDLFMAGRNLDMLGVDFSWLDFAAFVRFAPIDSQLAVEVNGVKPWPIPAVLLASILDSLRAANWQRGGGKGAKPKPTKVPGYGPTEKVYGQSRPLDEVQSYLHARNGRAPERRQ